MREVLIALNFLTIVPVGRNTAVSQGDLGRAVAWFPLVGVFLGGTAAVLSWVLHVAGLTLAADVLVVLMLAIATGGLHWDGLMDTADGVFSHRDREQKLAIMRDSRVGAMGVQAAAMLILLKVAVLFDISAPMKMPLLLLAPTVARFGMGIAVIKYPYARAEGGLGNAFAQKAGVKQLLIGLLTLLAATIPVVILFETWLPAVVMLLSLALALLTARFIAGKLQGLTGDTYGAICEITEIGALLLGAVLW